MPGFSEQAGAARFKAANSKYPYFSSALWALIPVEVKGLQEKVGGMMGVDPYWRLYYDPERVAATPVEQVMTALVHEVGHLLRGHHKRCQALNADEKAWNAFAADPEINDDLEHDGLQFPYPVMTPTVLGFPENLLAEEYYDLARQQAQQLQKQAKNGNPQAGGTGSPSGQQQGSTGQKPTNPGNSGTGSGKPQPGSGVMNGRCGSGAGGPAESYELGAPGSVGADGKVVDVQGVSEGEAELIRREVARKIQESAKARGTVPAGWQRWAESVLVPKIDWRREFARAVRSAVAYVAGMSDYSYSRPSRRSSVIRNVALPTMRRPVPNIAVVVDTSGSMSDRDMGAALQIVGQVLEDSGQRAITVLSCDAAVHTSKRIFKAEQVKLLGGGGTDMRIAIDGALGLKPRPNTLIVVTDAETPWPALAPANCNVVVALVGTGKTPDWAKVIRVIPDAKGA